MLRNRSETPTNICNLCTGIVDIILKDQLGVSPRVANNLALHEFEEMLGDKDCQEYLVCMPKLRLTHPESVVLK